MSGCQKNKTEIMLDGQDTVSESETQDDTRLGMMQQRIWQKQKYQQKRSYRKCRWRQSGHDFCGCLRSSNESGVYELDGSSRIFQAIEAAGGFLPEAAASAVNQAQPVSDGQQIYVLRRKKRKRELYLRQYAADPGSETTDANGVVNINTADAAALKSLSGIGDAKAQAILTYREEHGSFSSIEEIMQVRESKKVRFRR